VITWKKLELTHLKLTPTKKSFNGPNGIELYIPMDPKYMYSAENRVNGRYTWNNSINDTNNQPADYGLEHLMLQRQDLIFSKIDMLYSEIYERRKIKETNLYRINLDQCCFKSMIYARGDHLWDRSRLELEHNIIGLEQDKRREESNYFRDISFIRKELRESLIEKKEEEQKANLLMNQQEEST
jgi:hypothetical protein